MRSGQNDNKLFLWSSLKKYFYYTSLIVLWLSAHAFVACAIYQDFKKSIAVLSALALLDLYLIYNFVVVSFYKNTLLERFCVEVTLKATSLDNFKYKNLVKIGAILLFAGGVIAWLAIDTRGDRIRLRSLSGIQPVKSYYLMKEHERTSDLQIKWHPVVGGLILQFCVGLLVLRWSAGNVVIKFVADQAVVFLDFATVGAKQIYGFISEMPDICGIRTVFIFTSLQIIIYFGAVVSVLYYYGVIQAVLSRIAWFMQHTIGTTAAESLNAAACIFLGQTEAAILVEPALISMTDSEIHSIMTAGYACIAGSLFAAYIAFGACPTYLFSATVMSAAVSLSISKIVYPETQKSTQKNAREFKFAQREATNVLECVSNGAVHSAKFVWAIGANLVVYTALLYLANAIITYFGGLIGIADLTFNKILGYAFFPLAYLMGVSDAKKPEIEIHETLKVAELMGMKTVLNEFMAYQRLSEMVLRKELVGKRAIMMATYALCGFSNISMIGSQIGILSSMCPERKSSFSKVAVRGLISGIFSCFITTCVAGKRNNLLQYNVQCFVGVLVENPDSCSSITHAAKCLNTSI
ncbi:Sodium/nucleoside cotransporter [Aphelenchoides besseyi]|nr:Sodium/nucleoside cotransporter [Aphelenchoides besseyi]